MYIDFVLVSAFRKEDDALDSITLIYGSVFSRKQPALSFLLTNDFQGKPYKISLLLKLEIVGAVHGTLMYIKFLL